MANLGSINTFTAGTVIQAAPMNQNMNYLSGNTGWYPIISPGGSAMGASLIKMSGTQMVNINGVNTKYSDDKGLTWTDVTTDIDDLRQGLSCKANPIKGFAGGSNSSYYTINNGMDWTKSSGLAGLPYSYADYTNDGSIICGGMFSIDNGVNFTNGAGSPVHILNMVENSLIGYGANTSEQIVKTTNGGSLWSYVAVSKLADINVPTARIFSTSTSGAIILSTDVNGLGLEYYDDTITTSKKIINLPRADYNEGTKNLLTNILKITNGNLYFGIITVILTTTVDATISTCTLYKSVDNGMTWQMKILPAVVSPSDLVIVNFTGATRLIEYGTNEILFLQQGYLGGMVIQINENY